MQAYRSSAAAAAVLIIMAQVACSARVVVPEVVLMRIKRSPEPMRSFSFSGFNPNGQLAAFTGMAEYPMFGGNNYGPPSLQASPYYGQQAQDTYGPPPSPHAQDSYGPPPSGVEQSAATDPGKVQYGAASQSAEYGSKPFDSKEQSVNSVEQTDNKKQHRGRDGPSSNAEASFNAWFPIMFGVFPNGNGGAGQSAGGNGGAGRGQEPGPYGGNGFERSSAGGGTTVIANSVSNGRNGVATSHAIAYGNPRSSQK